MTWFPHSSHNLKPESVICETLVGTTQSWGQKHSTETGEPQESNVKFLENRSVALLKLFHACLFPLILGPELQTLLEFPK